MLSHPLGQPRVARLAASPATGLLYLVFDLALSPDTRRFPGKAWVDFSIHRFSLDPMPRQRLPGGGGPLPGAAPGRLCPSVPAPNARGSGCRSRPRRRSTGPPTSASARTSCTTSARWPATSSWASPRFATCRCPIRTPCGWTPAPPRPPGRSHDPALDAAVLARLEAQHRRGNPRQRREAEAILSSGFHDGSGRLIYRWSPAGQIPWCGGKAGCAFFPVSADPAIADRRWPLNKARADWDATGARQLPAAPRPGRRVRRRRAGRQLPVPARPAARATGGRPTSR